MAIINGTDGADALQGTPLDDEIRGFGGVDRIVTGDGTDRVNAGDGNDEVNGYLVDAATGEYAYYEVAGAKQIAGEGGDDFLIGGSAGDSIDGGTGADRLDGRAGDDTLSGGAGDDTLYGGAGQDTLDGGSGSDLLQGDDGDDTYWVRDATDRIVDSGGDDTAYITVDGVKLPQGIEHVVYLGGARPLPYWIDALVPASGAGLHARTLLGPDRSYAYAFPSQLPAYDLQPEDAQGFLPFTDAQAARARQALATLSTLVDLRFVETADPAAPRTIAFANNAQAGSDGYAWLPNELPLGSDVFLNRGAADMLQMPDGAPPLLALVHELGHALGLKHPFAAGGDPPYLGVQEDSTAWTVMSYQARQEDFALRWSPLDIAALQYLYGPSVTARAGDDRYLLSDTETNLIWDGAGHDLIDASALSQGVTAHLDPGWWDGVGATRADRITAAGQLTVNFGTAIEDLRGTAFADQLFGNALANQLDGGGGDDNLQGGGGDDRLDGGAGTDTAVYAGARADYLLARDAATGALLVTARMGTEGTDRLGAIEILRFADTTVDALAAPSLALQVVQREGAGPLAGVRLQADAPAAVATTTAADGHASLAGLPAAALVLQASLPIDTPTASAAADAAVDLQDAIAILRMVVGLGVGDAGQAATGLQTRAADLDQDGQVGLGDAIAVLRHVVGLDAPTPAWQFFDAADPALAAPGTLSHGPVPALAVDLGSAVGPVPLTLVGVLSGDVDASLVWPVDPRFAGP